MPELSARIGAERVPTGQFPAGQGGVAAYSSNEREWPRMNAEKGGMATDERGLTRISKNKCYNGRKGGSDYLGSTDRCSILRRRKRQVIRMEREIRENRIPPL